MKRLLASFSDLAWLAPSRPGSRSYDSATHHINLDTHERIIEADVRASAIVIAGVAYQLAMVDGRGSTIDRRQASRSVNRNGGSSPLPARYPSPSPAILEFAMPYADQPPLDNDALRKELVRQHDGEVHDRGLIVERLGWTPEQRLEANAAFLRFYVSVRPGGPLISGD